MDGSVVHGSRDDNRLEKLKGRQDGIVNVEGCHPS